MLYDYKCDCGKLKEIEHSIKEDPEVLCECGKKMSRKIYGGSATIFNGRGWAGKGDDEPLRYTKEIGVAIDQDKKRRMEMGED